MIDYACAEHARMWYKCMNTWQQPISLSVRFCWIFLCLFATCFIQIDETGLKESERLLMVSKLNLPSVFIAQEPTLPDIYFSNLRSTSPIDLY